MSKPVRSKIPWGKRGQSPVVLFLLLLVWSICLGWGMSLAVSARPVASIAQAATVIPGPVDPIPERYHQGYKLYLENCSGCHIAIPPEVLPTDSWRQTLLEIDQHYGKSLEIIGPVIQIMWNYLRAYSRPLIIQTEDEPIPELIRESRYFKALHPRVDLPRRLTHESCVTCHPGVAQYDYRTLTPEWENSL
ncbi:MAG: cytochrome C [Symploca sp. SIO2E6]|nr:cytochrome C [Symploca sp. SIO2E6]